MGNPYPIRPRPGENRMGYGWLCILLGFVSGPGALFLVPLGVGLMIWGSSADK